MYVVAQIALINLLLKIGRMGTDLLTDIPLANISEVFRTALSAASLIGYLDLKSGRLLLD